MTLVQPTDDSGAFFEGGRHYGCFSAWRIVVGSHPAMEWVEVGDLMCADEQGLALVKNTVGLLVARYVLALAVFRCIIPL